MESQESPTRLNDLTITRKVCVELLASSLDICLLAGHRIANDVQLEIKWKVLNNRVKWIMK